MKVYKHVVKITILSTDENVEDSFGNKDWDLSDVQYAITEGDCIGSVDHDSTEEVPALEVEKELISLGNDGTFFDDLDDEDDEAESQRRDEKNGLYGEHEDPCN
jgi:hypothetical protein